MVTWTCRGQLSDKTSVRCKSCITFWSEGDISAISSSRNFAFISCVTETMSAVVSPITAARAAVTAPAFRYVAIRVMSSILLLSREKTFFFSRRADSTTRSATSHACKRVNLEARSARPQFFVAYVHRNAALITPTATSCCSHVSTGRAPPARCSAVRPLHPSSPVSFFFLFFLLFFNPLAITQRALKKLKTKSKVLYKYHTCTCTVQNTCTLEEGNGRMGGVPKWQ